MRNFYTYDIYAIKNCHSQPINTKVVGKYVFIAGLWQFVLFHPVASLKFIIPSVPKSAKLKYYSKRDLNGVNVIY